jgi:tetratricopeptide (TPR) repeat protein
MLKGFLFIALCLVPFLDLGAQDQHEDRIKACHARLQAAQGEERVKCINDLAHAMLLANFNWWDSSLYYSKLAIREASESGYQKVLCRANLIHGDGLLQLQRSIEGEKYFQNAVDISTSLQDEVLMAIAHRRLGQSLWYQGKFRLAIDKINVTIPLFEKQGDFFQLINCYSSIADIYNDWGNFEQGFIYSQKALELSRGKNDQANIIQCYILIGSLYANIGDYETAFNYNRQAFSVLGHCNNCYHQRALNIMKGNFHRSLGNYDSSMYYLLKGYKGNPTSTLTKLFIAETLIELKRYDTALQILNFLQNFDNRMGAAAKRWRLNTAIGAAYYGLKDHQKAIQFTSAGLRFAEEEGIRGEFIPAALKLLSAVYKELGRPDSSLHFLEQFANAKDSIISQQLKGKLFEFRRIAEDERKMAQIELLRKQRQISEQQLVGGIIIVLLISSLVLWYVASKRRNERVKNERLQSQLQHKATELEMQALRAQMNPHFIFNCLSSVNRFILKNETEAASDYLTRFSRLIRLVLIHSSSSKISLKDEIEMLKLYLEMEQLRFRNAFDYTISFSNSIDPENIFIPPLLLQPFCENAIWHGLVHKETKGVLNITMSKEVQQLYCIIEDNGIGRAKAGEFKNRTGDLHKSLGLKITGERLALINKETGSNTSYVIEDLVDEKGDAIGTRVLLSIHCEEEVEELV